MPYRRFARWHIPAAVLWSTWLVGASYLAGASYDRLASHAGRAGAAVVALVALIAALILTGRWFARLARRPAGVAARRPAAAAVAGHRMDSDDGLGHPLRRACVYLGLSRPSETVAAALIRRRVAALIIAIYANAPPYAMPRAGTS